jgi:hypothetical protein
MRAASSSPLPTTVDPGTVIGEMSRLLLRVARQYEIVGTEITGREIVPGAFAHTPAQRRAATS